MKLRALLLSVLLTAAPATAQAQYDGIIAGEGDSEGAYSVYGGGDTGGSYDGVTVGEGSSGAENIYDLPAQESQQAGSDHATQEWAQRVQANSPQQANADAQGYVDRTKKTEEPPHGSHVLIPAE